MKQIVIKVVWLMVLLIIPLLSIFGRPLQSVIRERLTSDHLSLVFISTGLVLIGTLIIAYREKPKKNLWVHLVWATLLFVLLPLFLSTVEERLHFIVFGLLGFFSVLAFGFPKAIVFCLLIGGLDEILQWYLPDRVGDLRDVGFNCISGVGGCALAYFLGRRNKTLFPTD